MKIFLFILIWTFNLFSQNENCSKEKFDWQFPIPIKCINDSTLNTEYYTHYDVDSIGINLYSIDTIVYLKYLTTKVYEACIFQKTDNYTSISYLDKKFDTIVFSNRFFLIHNPFYEKSSKVVELISLKNGNMTYGTFHNEHISVFRIDNISNRLIYHPQMELEERLNSEELKYSFRDAFLISLLWW